MRSRKPKAVKRIASEYELKNVAVAKKDIGTIKRKQYSKIAQRMVPKCLHSLYGLPKKDKNRKEKAVDAFLRQLYKSIKS